MVKEFADLLHTKANKRLWIISDLQQSVYENAEYCMKCAVADFKELGLDCERIVYLGDAVEGHNMDSLIRMTQMQIEELGSIGVEICYTIGNHEFDFFNHNRGSLDKMTVPFYEMVKESQLWKTQDKLEDFYFIEEFEDFALVFLTDHAAQNGTWFTTHGSVHGDAGTYPYGADKYAALNEKISQIKKIVFTFSHYAFAGGNRPAPLFDNLLPLPDNVKIHFYGHAHIGDTVWAGKDCHRKISCVDKQNIPQIDVASLENIRGNAIRSVFLEIYEEGYGVLFRNHSDQKWEEIYIIESQ